MSVDATVIATFCAALSSGLLAGVFFAFSSFVMTALSRLPADQAVVAMQAINVAVFGSLFMGVFLGTAGLCTALVFVALRQWGRAGPDFVLGSSVLYLVGTFLVAVVFNVPLNNALARIGLDAVSGNALGLRYFGRWRAWNHVRTLSALAASAGFMAALLRQRVVL